MMNLTPKELTEKTGISYATLTCYLAGRNFTDIHHIRGLYFGVQDYHIQALKDLFKKRNRRKENN